MDNTFPFLNSKKVAKMLLYAFLYACMASLFVRIVLVSAGPLAGRFLSPEAAERLGELPSAYVSLPSGLLMGFCALTSAAASWIDRRWLRVLLAVPLALAGLFLITINTQLDGTRLLVILEEAVRK